MIHLIKDNVQELDWAINRVRISFMEQTTTSSPLVDMPSLVVHKRGPLFIAVWIFAYAVLKKVALSRP